MGEQNMQSHLHGVVWHSISIAGPLQEYPSDIAHIWCKGAKRHDLRNFHSDGMYGETPTDHAVVQNCFHGLGHAAFFALAYTDLDIKVSARNPLYPPAYTLSNASVALAT